MTRTRTNAMVSPSRPRRNARIRAAEALASSAPHEQEGGGREEGWSGGGTTAENDWNADNSRHMVNVCSGNGPFMRPSTLASQ